MGIMDIIKSSLSEAVKGVFNTSSIGEKIIFKIKLELWKFEKRIINNLMVGFILTLSLIILALASIFFLMEYVGLNKTLSFLTIGIILLLIGIIIKWR